jgi:iron complex outermembrane receptor protein
MKNFLFHCAALLCALTAAAQTNDTLRKLDEVVVIGPKKELNLKQAKPLASIDDYLQQSGLVTMIRRGAYAWEPAINGMATERTLVTIEGMHIFGACTDKMDPITSYVDVSNLAEAAITSGQHGSGFGATIGGAIDLKRNRTGFSPHGWKTVINSGFESNAGQKILGAAVNYSNKSFFIDTDAMHRDAGNYTAGNNEEIAFSQFAKLNLSDTAGFLVAKNAVIEASVILDRATNIGYPALPMDVSLAEALITSARFELKPENALVSVWDSKLYYNSVTHIMDDTARPDVAIHMDMPGRTKTYGGYSSVGGKYKSHTLKANLNAYYNVSNAEMTMYPENPDENPMFMLTWPDVRTLFSGLFFEDNYAFNCHSALKITASAAHHSNTVASDFGLESMRIFYPKMPKTNNRLLKSAAASYSFKKGLTYSFGIGYGERAPSVSEGYGFYLFNSFDNYDYIGNPTLKNEKSLEGNASVEYTTEKISAKISSAYFHITDYVIGRPDESLLPMTLGANGVKVYTALDFATIFNTYAEFAYRISTPLAAKTRVGYSSGSDRGGNNLPFISPLNYTVSLNYKKSAFSAELIVTGNGSQERYAPEFGENHTPDYAILNGNAGYSFRMDQYRLHAKIGVENALDAYYSTFGDWNDIPRPGRNFYVNLIFQN